MSFGDRGGEWMLKVNNIEHRVKEEIKHDVDELNLYFDFSNLSPLNSKDELSEPTEIHAYIEPNVSLKDIHDGIRSRFIYELTMLKTLTKELASINKIKCFLGDKYEERIASLIEEQSKYKPLEMWENYKKQSLPVLLKYLPLMPCEVKGTISERVFTYIEEQDRLKLIFEYVEIANATCSIQINTFYKFEEENYCHVCGTSFNSLNDGKCKCGIERDDISHFPEEDAIQEYDTEKQTNTNPKPQIEWLHYFLGEGEYPEVNIELFNEMDKICIKENLPTSEDVKDGTEEGTSDLLLSIMKKIGIRNYKLKNIIGSRYWDWELPVMTEEQKEQFIKNCTLTRLIYPQVSKRIQNLNLDVTGFYLFGAQGLRFPGRFFKFPNNKKSISDANEVWKKTCKKANLTCVLMK